MDEQRKLVLVADEGRIKSFVWASPLEHESGSEHHHSGLPVHTMDSLQFSGPLYVANGHVFRAGHGSAAAWKIDNLENHGPKGTTRIGKKIIIDDEWQDDSEDVECSSGSTLCEKISFDDEKLRPWHWHAHPSEPGTMICVSDPHKTSSYSCVALELETGKTSGRYLGHGARVTNLSTSEADPHVFVTACGDGCARLYDTRHHMPVLTFDVGHRGDICPAVIICHPDGTPSAYSAVRLLALPLMRVVIISHVHGQ
jgi:hypothetical protein